MPFQLSPGVAVVEKDFSSIVPAVSSSAGAFAGPFAWGPIEDPVRVSSESDLVARFGAPKNENFQSFFTAANFLAYTNNMLVCRTDATNLKNAVSVQSGSVTGVTNLSGGSGYVLADSITVSFSAPQVAGGTTATGTVTFTTSESGGTTFKNITGVTIVNPGSGYTSAPTVTFSAPSGSGGTTATATAVIASGGVKIKNVSTYLYSFANGTGSYGPWAAKFAGTKGNGLRIIAVDKGGWAAATAEIKGLFPSAPGTSNYAADNGIADDELHIAVLDNARGDFSGVPGTVLEKYTFVSKLSDARRSDGSNNYYKSVINSQSKYVWWMDHLGSGSSTDDVYTDWSGTTVVASGQSVTFTVAPGGANLVVGSTTNNWATLQAFKTAFDAASDKADWKVKITGHGTNNGTWTVTAVTPIGSPVTSYSITLVGTTLAADAAPDSDVVVTNIAKLAWGTTAETAAASVVTAGTNKIKLLSEYSDISLSGGKDDYASGDANILAGYTMFENSDVYDISLVPVGNVSATTAAAIVNVLENRKDCVVFISPNDNGDPITSTGSTATTAIINYRNATALNTSYAVIDSGWKYQYDRYNDAYRWVPLNGDIAGLCARTDYNADPWFSPGGFNRGQIKNVVKLGFNPGQADRDALYPVGINPVVNFPGQGVILYGDKTMLTKPSAFDRINVRRLFIVLEKAIAVAAKYQMFEFNDSFTRSQFKNLVEPFLRDVQGRRGVTDFRVKCDETNNTGEVVDRNEFIADIFIKPNRSINYITLNFVAARSSVSFEEIGA
jgi:phage tail sheath protein FI